MKARNRFRFQIDLGNMYVPNRFRQYVIATFLAPLIGEFLLFILDLIPSNLDLIHFVETSYIKNK